MFHHACLSFSIKSELPVLAMFVNGSQMSNLYRGPSIDATYHVSIHLAKQAVLAMFVNGSQMSKKIFSSETA
jgi:hypothetical protein